MRAAQSVVETAFEGAPWFVERVLAGGRMESDVALIRRAREVALAMAESEQVALLAAHPRIGAAPGAVSAMAYREQGYDRDPVSLTDELARLNDAYEDRFGFRYVVFVNGRPRSEIARLLEEALSADRDAELQRGLDDVVSIAADRLRRVREDGA